MNSSRERQRPFDEGAVEGLILRERSNSGRRRTSRNDLDALWTTIEEMHGNIAILLDRTGLDELALIALAMHDDTEAVTWDQMQARGLDPHTGELLDSDESP